MYAEEVRIKNGSEDRLLYGDFGENGKEFGLEVEVVVEEHEPSESASHQQDVLRAPSVGQYSPVVGRNGGSHANRQMSHSSQRIITPTRSSLTLTIFSRVCRLLFRRNP